MSREDFVAIASRIFAVYLLLSTIKLVPSALQLRGQDDWLPVSFVVGLLIAGIILSIFFWFFPLTIARMLLPVMGEPRSDNGMNASLTLSVGFTLIGVWLFAGAITDAVYWGTFLLHIQREFPSQTMDWGSSNTASIVATAVQLLISLWLIFGSTGIRNMIERFKYAGLPPEQP